MATAPDDFLGLASRYAGVTNLPVLPQGDVLPSAGFNVLGEGLGLLNPGLVQGGLGNLPAPSFGGGGFLAGLSDPLNLVAARNQVQGLQNMAEGLNQRFNPDAGKQGGNSLKDALLRKFGGQGQATAATVPGQQAGQFAAQTSAFQQLPADQQALAAQIMQQAVDKIGPAAGPVVGAILLQENGLGGQAGDNGQSFGPFQFYTGGQLPGYAQARGLPLAQAGPFAQQNPLDAASYALDTYLGTALRQGLAQGHTGEALLRDALRTQNPGVFSSLPAYQAYANRLQGFAATPAAAGNPPANPGAQALLSQLDTYVGTPYVLGGTSRSGIDCSGLIVAAMRDLGKPLPAGVRTAQQLHNYSQPVAPQAVQPGDLVFFERTYAGNPGERDTHVGVITQNGVMINASGSQVNYADLNNPYWQSRITGWGRLPQ